MSSSAAQLVASALLRRGIFSGLQTSRSLIVIPQHTSSILGQTSLFSTDAGNNESSSSFASTSGGASQGERTYRSGVVAVKVGMTQEWDHWGMRIPLTVLWLDECEVVQVKTQEKEGYTGLQLGCGSKRRKQLPPSLCGHFDAAGVPLKRKLVEFRVSPQAVLPVGHVFSAAHFVPGQYVDVAGTTIGKGFQGVMKRWGFSGQPASHGNSLSHRAAGSTGACQVSCYRCFESTWNIYGIQSTKYDTYTYSSILRRVQQ